MKNEGAVVTDSAFFNRGQANEGSQGCRAVTCVVFCLRRWILRCFTEPSSRRLIMTALLAPLAHTVPCLPTLVVKTFLMTVFPQVGLRPRKGFR